TSDVEVARANNRQGLPVGAQYLRNASSGLREVAVPQLAALIDTNGARVESEIATARSATWLLVSALTGLAVLVLAMMWLAQRTHRDLNLPMALAGVLLLGYLVLATAATSDVATTARDTRNDAFTAAQRLAEARIAAFDAKANESLTLIARGSGAAFEEAWQESSATTVAALGSGTVDRRAGSLGEAWQAYAELHADLRAADDGGDWEGAVALATARGEGTANAAFARFDEESLTALETASRQTTDALDRARGPLLPYGLAGAAVGLAVAALCWRGIGRRIEEYR
ncbi:MAG TPA: hypothetical protein PKB06_07945, partial [Actinotalea sp.]|nr:hypothetical protein [Actinotalea sp.]